MKKRALKLTSLFLVSAMLISMFAGCGKKEENKGNNDSCIYVQFSHRRSFELLCKNTTNYGDGVFYWQKLCFNGIKNLFLHYD